MQEEEFWLAEESEEDEFVRHLPVWKRVLRGVVALVLVVGLLNISGIQQFFFLRETPAGARQEVLASKVEGEELVVPVVAHVLVGPAGSGRTEDDVRRLLTNANNIWAQGNISFELREVRRLAVSLEDLQQFERVPQVFIEASGSYDPAVANVYLTRTLAGVNGLAYGGLSAVSVADYTSILDFRTLAHEFGHLLGLGHVEGGGRLMSTGAAGVELTEEELRTAREQAEGFEMDE